VRSGASAGNCWSTVAIISGNSIPTECNTERNDRASARTWDTARRACVATINLSARRTASWCQSARRVAFQRLARPVRAPRSVFDEEPRPPLLGGG
jgi:hypothetical protein